MGPRRRTFGAGRALAPDLRLAVLAFLAGVLAVHSLPAAPPLWLFPAPLAACLFRFPGRLSLALFLLGAAYTTVQVGLLEARRLPSIQHGTEQWLSGHIEGLPEVDEFRTRFLFATDRRPQRIRVSWYGGRPDELRPGDCWRLRLKLNAPRGSLNPGTFDYEAWLWRKRIGATGYVRDAERCGDNRPAVLDGWRQAAVRRLDAALQGHPMTGLLLGLSLGERSAIDDHQWRVLRHTGTSHLMAISGLHVGLIAAAIFGGLRWLVPRVYWRPWPSALALAVIGAAVAAAGYAALSGFGLPARRALVMLLAVLGAVLWRRRTAPSRLLAIAAGAVLLLDPFAVLAPGFWLSFGAVAWILYLAGGRWRAGPWRWLRLQPALVLALMPLTLYWFGEASLVAALANAVLIPAFAIVVPAVLLAALLGLALPELGVPMLQVLAALFQQGWRGLEYLAGLPGAFVGLPAPGLPELAVALFGVAWLLAPRGVPARWLGLVALLPLLFGPPPPAHGGFRLTLLDVGQGLAAVVRTADHSLLFDAGPRYRTGFDTGEAIVVPYLRSRGIRRLDMQVLSHGDIDHRGGLEAVRAALPVTASLGVDQQSPCRAGREWTWDGVTFSVLHPNGGGWRGNNASCVLRIVAVGGTVLLTGDIEAAAERHLVETYGDRLAADVLVVPHHGSASSTSAAFLRRVAPAHALVPAGWRNRWDFPAETVRERLATAGAQMHISGEVGALRVDIDPRQGILPPRGWRREDPAFWRAD